MMKQLAIKTVIFLALLAVVFSFADDAFKERRIGYYSRNSYDRLDKNVDIAIFGSSHGLNAVDPRIIEKEYGKTTFNFSMAGQRIISTLPLLDEILVDNKVELAILEIFSGTVGSLDKSWDEKARFFQYNTLDNIDYSSSKIITHNKIFGLDEFYNMFPVVRRHHKWTNLVDGTTFILDQNADFYNGFYSRFRFEQKHWDKQLADKRKVKNRNIVRTELKESEKENIDEVIEKFREHEVPFLIISAPFYVDSLGLRIKSHQQLVVDYIKSKEVPFIDFNKLWEELRLNQHDFVNSGHLNTKGSLKVSRYLTAYIQENNDLERQELDNRKIFKNRYAILDNEKSEILYKKDLDSIIIKEYGANKLYFFNPFINKYEILLKMEESAVNEVHLFYEYEYDPSEQGKIDKFQRGLIREDGVVEERLVPKTKLRYNDATYQVHQFNSVFDKVKNFKLFIIKGEKRIEIINLAELKLSDGNR